MNDISQLFNAPNHKNGIELGFLKPRQSVSGIWKSIINEKKKEPNKINYNPYSREDLHVAQKGNFDYSAIHCVGWVRKKGDTEILRYWKSSSACLPCKLPLAFTFQVKYCLWWETSPSSYLRQTFCPFYLPPFCPLSYYIIMIYMIKKSLGCNLNLVSVKYFTRAF